MTESRPRRKVLRSIAAVLAGFAGIVAISTLTDQVLHSSGVYPPLDQRMSDPLFALALAYRIVYGVAGCWLTARLAPYRPMLHALVLGSIGMLLSTLGALAMGKMGPAWYSIALIATAIPSAWVGAKLVRTPVRA